ncbi:MAG: sulfate adenylyltransferase, partial [Leptospiraceae bacterium]|nr:sulfate adenylyltransferase [Leptospiraceae bacterium]
ELEQLDYACAPMSVTVRLQDDIDISRGDIIVQHDRKPFVERQFAATICWMDEGTLHSRRRYILQINTRRVPCMITGLRDRLNIHTLERETEIERVEMNDIARVEIKTASPVYFDDYRTNHRTGSFILIDESSNNTVAAGMVEVEPAFQI